MGADLSTALCYLGRCSDALSSVTVAVEATMDARGGRVPWDALVPSLTSNGAPWIAILRMVWGLTKVRKGSGWKCSPQVVSDPVCNDYAII